MIGVVFLAYVLGALTGAYIYRQFTHPDLLLAEAEARHARIEALRVKAQLSEIKENR